jgi:uncharacterized protein
MTVLPITALWVAVAALGLVALSVPVAVLRKRSRTSLGDAGDARLQQRIRAQANYAEYVPLALLVLGFVEACGYPAWTVWALGGVLAVGRIMHASAIYSGTLGPRVFGMTATWGMLVVSAVMIAVCGVQAL